MKNTIRAAVAAIALTAIPAAALAASTTSGPDHTYQLTTVESQQYGVGVVDGRMRVTIRPDGILQGTYQNEDDGLPHNVSGGVDADGSVWFEIGNGPDATRYVGTFHDGTLHTTLQASSNSDVVHLDAKVQ
jgi:hypothetical protein